MKINDFKANKTNLLKLTLDIYGIHVIKNILITFEFEYYIDIYNFIIKIESFNQNILIDYFRKKQN